MKQMDDSTRARFKQELQRDKSKPFAEEFVRTTNLERLLLDEFGHDGAQLLLQHSGYDTSFDKSCPWQVRNVKAVGAVRQVLAPVYRMLPKFVAALEERVTYVIPVRSKGDWVLAYIVDRALYDDRRYYQIILGGAPNPAPRLSDRASSLGWAIPASLALLYSVHEGFGADACGIVDSSSLVDMGQMMDPISAEQNVKPEGYVFQDLLEFFPDGSGNCQAFHRRDQRNPDPPTVDWDHETWEISDETPFYEFVDERLLGQILDEE